MSNRKSVLIHAAADLKQLKDHSGGQWSPLSEHRGVPGTEEAVINISRELTAYPLDIVVVSPCGAEAGTYNGVTWIDAIAFDPGQFADFDHAFFLHHEAALECVERGLRAKQIYLWLENNYPEETVLPFMDFYAKLMPLTPWSRSLYPRVADQQIFLTRNGVKLQDIDAHAGIQRQRHRLVYGSDYDRGLVTLLNAWPQIKQLFPEATLDVFYGWNIFDKKTDNTQDPEQKRQRLTYKEAVNQMLGQPGITHHGRVGHPEVARLFCQADIWAYPCTFPESSCITAMKAQIAGRKSAVVWMK